MKFNDVTRISGTAHLCLDRHDVANSIPQTKRTFEKIIEVRCVEEVTQLKGSQLGVDRRLAESLFRRCHLSRDPIRECGGFTSMLSFEVLKNLQVGSPYAR